MWIPYKHFTHIDAINAHSAAIGSYQGAIASQGSNYYGHYVQIDYCRNSYWRASYIFAGIQVIARGSFEEVVFAAAEFNKRDGGYGSCVVMCETLTPEQEAFARLHGFVEHSPEIEKATFKAIATWQVDEVANAFWAQKHLGYPAVAYLANSKTKEEYEAKIAADETATFYRKAKI